MISLLRQTEDQWTMTHSGIRFNLENPRPEDILIEDIAHALARINRYNGHHNFEHYSVAQHSVHVSEVISGKHKLAGLLHDASEAYLQDIISPLKYLLREVYLPLEERCMRVIYSKFGIDYDDQLMQQEVKFADQLVFAFELRDVKKTDEREFYNLDVNIGKYTLGKISSGYSATNAESLFLETFRMLT